MYYLDKIVLAYGLVAPMFTENVRWVSFSFNKGIYVGAGCKCFANIVIRKHEVVFVQSGIRLSRTINNGLIVSEEYRLALYWDTEIK